MTHNKTISHDTPELSYTQALRQFVAWHSEGGNAHVGTIGAIFGYEMVPGDEFARLVQRAIRTARAPGKAKHELGLYDETEYDGPNALTWRFYAMTELLSFGCRPFWFDSYVDATSPNPREKAS